MVWHSKDWCGVRNYTQNLSKSYQSQEVFHCTVATGFKMVSFSKVIASRGYHVYRLTTWRNIKKDQKCTFCFETRKEALSIDKYSISVQIFPKDRVAPVTVGHVPLELSRYVYYFMKLGGNVSGCVLSTMYKPSPIPEWGLEIPLTVTFEHESEHILNQMKTFVIENYDEIVEEIEVLESDDGDYEESISINEI